MPFPSSATDIDALRPMVEEHVHRRLAPGLCAMIARRAAREGLVDGRAPESLAAALADVVRSEIAPRIVEVVLHPDPLHRHDRHTPGNRRLLVATDDTLESLLRDLVHVACGAGADRDVVRRKVTGCTNAVLAVVNSEHFVAALRQQGITIATGSTRRPSLRIRRTRG